MTYAVIGYCALFFASAFFSVVTVIRVAKFSAVWGTIACVFWFVLAQITPWVFIAGSTSVGNPLIALAWLWYMLGIIFEVFGITFTFLSLDAEKAGKEYSIE